MRTSLVVAALCAAVLWSGSDAASRNFKGYRFEAHVSPKSGRYQESRRSGRQYIQVREGDEYSVVINNPLPVRVAVAVSIDGLNTIDGKRASPRNARKWIIEANSSLTLRGWQTSDESLRRFVFTDQNASYAEWKESKDKRDYTRNLGVIGVAYFWNDEELQLALNPPVPFDEELSMSAGAARRAEAAPACPSAKASRSAEKKAGTGMGRREHNSVRTVEFHYDTGMYANKDVVTIFYEFAPKAPPPLPFDDDGEFAADMHR